MAGLWEVEVRLDKVVMAWFVRRRLHVFFVDPISSPQPFLRNTSRDFRLGIPLRLQQTED